MGVQNRRIHALERLYIPKAVAIFIIGFCPNPPRQSMGEGHTTGTYKNILPSISISLSLSLSLRSVAWFWSSVCRSRPGGSPGGIHPSLGVLPGDHPRRSPQGTPPKDPRRGSPQGTLPIPPPHFLLCFRSYPPGRSPPKGSPQHIPSGDTPGDTPRGPPGDSPRGPPSLFRLPTSSFVSQAKPANTLMCESFCTNPTCSADATTCPH
jgi:hypothetical protein